MQNPTKEEIKQAREHVQAERGLGITAAQEVCAALIYKKLRAWQQWENGDRAMDPALWELFLIKIGIPGFPNIPRCRKNETCDCLSNCGDDKPLLKPKTIPPD